MKIVPLLLAAVVSASLSAGLPAAAPERPNILYFYVDDLGWGSIGPNAQAARKAADQPSVRTPHLDQLARQGVNFSRGYGCFVCSPARASQQSGFHQGHTYADRNDPDNARKAMRRDDILIGDALSAAGYITGYWGKWGFGGSRDLENPVIDNVQTLPTSHGYRHVLAELHHVRAHTFFQPTLWRAPAAASATGGVELAPNSLARYRDRADYPATPALQNHPAYPDTAYCDDHYAFAALDFVRSQAQHYRRTGQPFFGLLAVQIPHAPFDEITRLPEWDAAYADDPHFDRLAAQSQQWAAMVTRIDAHFGNILAALEDPNNDGDTSDSVADDTLVVFQSDNGGPGGKSRDELDSNGGLRGSKGTIYEGGIRVPLVMRWPGEIHGASKLKAGTTSTRVVDVTDLLPTFCELAGVDAPLGIDGVSIASTLRSRGHQRQRDFLIHEAGKHHSIIRGDYKLIRSASGRVQLYDLQGDPSESNNIAAKHPRLVEELETLLLGERVTEPKGFAVTYHQWRGDDGAETSDPDNWSDYRYANAGITYMLDAGAPQSSWIAHIANSGNRDNIARVDGDLEVLGLEVRGNADTDAQQSLVLKSDTRLTGRNEVRVGSQGTLVLNGGTVSSLRWVEVDAGATLRGHGRIDATLYNDGVLELERGGTSRLEVAGDFHQGPEGELRLSVGGADPPLQVHRIARLAGGLRVQLGRGFDPSPTQPIVLLTAGHIVGTFANSSHEVVAEDGRRFTIDYTRSSVRLTPL